MTDDEINIAIAEECGPRMFVILKINRGYYMSNACGYTEDIAKAWKVTEEVAGKHVTGPGYEREPDRIIAKPAPILPYTTDLNAMHEAEKVLDVSNGGPESGDCLRYAYSRELYRIVPMWTQPFRATARHRAKAFLRALGKWRDE